MSELFNEQALEMKIAEVIDKKLAEIHAMKSEPLVDAQIASAHIGVKVNTLRSWASTKYKGIPVHKFGKSVRFKLSELEEWSRLKAA